MFGRSLGWGAAGNVHISIAALTTAIGALVASIFGMNLFAECPAVTLVHSE